MREGGAIDMNRRFLARIMAAMGLRVATAWSQSLPYSNRPIRLIVPFPTGGAVDPIGRAIAQKLNEAWSRPVLVDDKFGNPSLPYPASRG